VLFRSDLVRRSLVLYDSGTKRYRLHDLARLFANTKLSDEEHAVGHKRQATHYRNLLEDVNALYLEGGESVARGLELFDLEWSNIEAGHSWVAAQGVDADEDIAELGLAYPDAGLYALNLRLHAREWIRWLEIALAAAQRLEDPEGVAVMLGNLGVAYRNLGETERAIQFHQQHLTIARERGDRKGEGVALGSLGNAYAQLGEHQRALEFYEQRLSIAREIGDRRGEGVVLGNMGNAYAQLGEPQQAIQFFEQRLSIAREIGDRRGEGSVLGNLGLVYAQIGKTQKATELCEQALLIDREIGDQRAEGNVLWNMSLLLNELNDRAKAIQYAEQSLIIRERIEDPDAAKVRVQLAMWRRTKG